MLIAIPWKNRQAFDSGIKWTSKIILQSAVVILGFGMNLGVIIKIGGESLPIIITTITTSLLIAYFLHKAMKIDENIATLVGVGSSICGGSAIAATAPVIDADDSEVAQAISVIFFFNVIAAIIFPLIGNLIGFDTESGHAFGIFAGTAVNDTSSVTAAASTWDSMWNLGSETLDEAVLVKLTRTLAIIPITLGIAIIRQRKNDRVDSEGSINKEGRKNKNEFKLKNSFPMFILYFIIAAIITTISASLGVSDSIFAPLKSLSKFLIVMAMAAIGLNSNMVKLIKTGGKPILLGASCWVGITLVSLLMQKLLHIW